MSVFMLIARNETVNYLSTKVSRLDTTLYITAELNFQVILPGVPVREVTFQQIITNYY